MRLRRLQAYGAERARERGIEPSEIPELVGRALTDPDPTYRERAKEITARLDLPKYEVSRDGPTSRWRTVWRVVETDRHILEIRDIIVDENEAIQGYSAEAVTYWGMDTEDLEDSIRRAAKAMEQPILIERELPGYSGDTPS